MYLINSMKSHSIVTIRMQDILLISICILLFLNRAVPIDYSSIWRVTVLCLIYTCIRIISKQYRNCLLHMVYIWGITEVIISILQKANYLESNHHDFGITGTFGNPGPLGGLLAVCWIVSIFFIYENIQNKHRILTLSFCMIACFILYGLLLSGSRAGWTAALVGSMIFLWQWLKRKHTIKVKPTLLKSSFLLIITVFIISIYFIRRDSADGRLLIWHNTITMIKDYPLFGIGAGGWQANYMLYQAEYFLQNPNSPYILLADNIFYAYNEFLHITAEQGIVGLVVVTWLLYALFSYKEKNNTDHCLKSALITFLVFSFFSYPGEVFPLEILFISIIGMMKSKTIKTFTISNSTKYIIRSIAFIFIVCISIGSYHIYHKTFTTIIRIVDKNKISKDTYSQLSQLYPLFRYNSQLMYIYSKSSLEDYPLNTKLQILQTAARIAPNSELYIKLGDFWKQKKDFPQAEAYYQTAAAMIPHHITPSYKLFQLYIEEGNINAATNMGNYLLKQPIKKKGTKALRMEAEVLEFLHKEKNIKRTQ